MTREELIVFLETNYPNDVFLLADGFELAFCGVAKYKKTKFKAVYDINLCIACLIDDGMTYQDAIEYLEFNVIDSYMGAETPKFVY